MIQNMHHHIGQDRQAEFLRQAQKNRQFEQRMHKFIQQIGNALIMVITWLVAALNMTLAALAQKHEQKHEMEQTDLQSGTSA